MKKKLWATILVIMMLVGTLSGCRIGDKEYVLYHKKVNSKVIFSINDMQCTLKEMQIYLCNYRNIYGNSYGVNLWEHGDQAEELAAYVKEVTLAEITRVFCMDLLAGQQEFELSEEELNLVEQMAKEYYSSLSSEEIAYMDIHQDDVAAAYSHYALAMKLYSTLTEGINEEVSDDEARVIRVLQIYVTDQSVADTVAQKLEGGEDFAAVAATYNTRPAVEVTVARGDYPAAVEETAFNLEEGAASGMITSEDGYYFVKCISKYEPELTEENKEIILQRREKEQFDDQYEAFVNSCSFELNQEMWDGLQVPVGEAGQNITTDSFFTVYNKAMN